MLYRIIKALITKGLTNNGLVDVLYAAGRLANKQHGELTGMLGGAV